MINYIFLSYILFPFAFALGLYLDYKGKINSQGETTPLWKWIVFVIGDFYKNKTLLCIFTISPLMLPIEICFIIKELLFPSSK